MQHVAMNKRNSVPMPQGRGGQPGSMPPRQYYFNTRYPSSSQPNHDWVQAVGEDYQQQEHHPDYYNETNQSTSQMQQDSSGRVPITINNNNATAADQ